jgi:hypothetical protein
MHANPIWEAAGPFDGGYGRELFERVWGKVDPGTRTWMLSAIPPAFRASGLLNTLALDWLLWDAPWLRGHPAGQWLRQSSFLGRGEQLRRVISSLLGSRVGLYRFDRALPGRGLELRDMATGCRTLVNTPTPPWGHTDRILALRILPLGNWQIAAGEGLLLPNTIAEEILESLEAVRVIHNAPAWPSPGWRSWSGAWLLPLIARHVTQQRMNRRVAHSTPDRYH